MRNLIDAITFVNESLQELDIDTSGQSRFASMKRVLERGIVLPTDPDFAIVLEAIRDAHVLAFFFEQFGNTNLSSTVIDVLRRAISDAPLPQDSKDDTAGRDAQAELYVATICFKAGLQPDFCEPDLMVQFNGMKTGIAVKRTKSERQIEKHLRKGAKQIAKAEVPGHIVLDISRAFNPDNTWLMEADQSKIEWAHIQARTLFAKKYFLRIKEWTEGRRVHSLILVDSIVRQHLNDDWTLDSFNYFIPLDQSSEGLERYACFRREFESGLATAPNNLSGRNDSSRDDSTSTNLPANSFRTTTSTTSPSQSAKNQLMSTAEISELRRLAELFRTAIEEAKRRPDDRVFFAEHFPRNCCDQASQMIFLFLYERGFRGFRRITANVGEQKHVWLRLNATIIDITADQFAQGTGRAVVADTSDWHSQLKIVSDKNLGMEGDSEASYRDRLLSDVFIPDCYYALRGYVEQIEREKNTINEGDQRLGFNGLSP